MDRSHEQHVVDVHHGRVGGPREVEASWDRVVVAGVCPLATTDYANHFDRAVRLDLRATVLGTCQTIHEPNTSPALPVREGEDVLVWLARLESAGDLDAFAERVAGLNTDGLAGAV